MPLMKTKHEETKEKLHIPMFMIIKGNYYENASTGKFVHKDQIQKYLRDNKGLKSKDYVYHKGEKPDENRPVIVYWNDKD